MEEIPEWFKNKYRTEIEGDSVYPEKYWIRIADCFKLVKEKELIIYEKEAKIRELRTKVWNLEQKIEKVKEKCKGI